MTTDHKNYICISVRIRYESHTTASTAQEFILSFLHNIIYYDITIFIVSLTNQLKSIIDYNR